MSEVACIFCNIIKGVIPATYVHESDGCIVIKDIAPRAPIHYLVIPKIHIVDLHAQQAPALMGQMVDSIQTLSKLHIIPESFRIIVNTGTKSGQTIFHLHIHVLAGKVMSSSL